MPTKPLLKALAEAGIGSRRRMTDAIRKGMVEINGEIAEDFHHPVNTETDRVSINGEPVNLKPEEIICLMLNKPKGVLSTTRDERGHRTVVDILPPKYRHLRLYPAGRLDKDSTGLLLLTNNGSLTHRLTHPRFEHEKEYLLHIDGSLKPGEKRNVTFTLTPKQISLLDENYRRVVEPGLFEVAVGGKQPGFKGYADARTTEVLTVQFEVVGKVAF